MATLGEYLGAGSGTTKLLLHFNGNSTDSSGNGSNGSDSNMTYGLANGKLGQGAAFNGTNAQITFTVAQPTTAYTINLWLNHNSSTADNNGGIWDSQNPAATGTGVVFVYNPSSNKLRVYHNNGSWSETDDLGTLLEDGVYRMITLTWDGSNLRFYVDGKKVKDNSYNTGITNWGTAKIGNRTTSNQYLSGNMDEFILENTAWSDYRIKKHFTYQKGRFGIL